MGLIRKLIRSQKLISAPPSSTVHQAAVLMERFNIGAMPVIDGETLVGVFSERDILTRVVMPERDPRATRLSEVMTKEVITTTPNIPLSVCLRRMAQHGCRHLPVISQGRVVAMLSSRDLLFAKLEDQREEIRSLRNYLEQAPLY